MKTIIFAGGEYTPCSFYKKISQECDLKIAADSGAEFMKTLDIRPDILIGDMDSISEETLSFYEKQAVKILKFPSRKDEIDTELALMEATKRQNDLILIAGAFGSRLDQTIAVFRLMQRFKNVALFNEKLYTIWIDKKTVLTSVPKEIWSILPLRKDVHDVSLSGFEYSIKKREMKYLNPYGVSNVAISSKVEIDPGDGALLVFRYHNGRLEWVEELSKIFGAR